MFDAVNLSEGERLRLREKGAELVKFDGGERRKECSKVWKKLRLEFCVGRKKGSKV